MPLIANPEDVDVSGAGWHWTGGYARLTPPANAEVIAEEVSKQLKEMQERLGGNEVWITGWQCPYCLRFNAPWEAECYFCGAPLPK